MRDAARFFPPFSPFPLFPFPPPIFAPCHDTSSFLQPLPIRRRSAPGGGAAGLIRLAGPPALPPLPSPAGDLEPGLRGGDREGAPPRGLFLPETPSLREVWAKAGGEGTAPDPDKIIASGSRVEVSPDGGYRVAAMSGDQLVTLGLPIDLNRATAEDLDAIPGLGPALAKRIIDYRQAQGPFKQIEDLREVSGIGPQNLPKLKPFLGLGSPEAMPPPAGEAAITAGNPYPGLSLKAGKDDCLGVKATSNPRPRAAPLIPTCLPRQTWKPCRVSVRYWRKGSLTTAGSTAPIKRSLT